MDDDDYELRPLPFDASAPMVEAMFDLDDEAWLYASAGDYETACVQAFKRDGTNLQTLIVLKYPVRRRGTGELSTVKLLISPEDAENLADSLKHSVEWLRAARLLGN